jgi:GT2 family glycosyltransferase
MTRGTLRQNQRRGAQTEPAWYLSAARTGGHWEEWMRYDLRDVELSDVGEGLALAPGFDGIGLILRERGRLVGFRMIARPEGADFLPAGALIDRETLEAAAVERRRALPGETRDAPGPAAPSITIAICSKDRWDWVDRLLRSIEALPDREDLEILVVDNASADARMRTICEGRPGVRHVREDLVGLNFARNRAIREARGAIVAFLDDDVTVDRNWLRGMRRAWSENPDAGCVTGLVLPMALETEAQIRFELRGGFRRGFRPFRFGRERYRERHHPGGAGRFGAGANMSLRRDAVRALGGFDEALDTGRPLPGGGDLDIFYRVIRSGAVLVYEPQACVFHEHRREMRVLRRQYYTWGLGFAAFVAKSMRADPPMRRRFQKLLVWWFGHQAGRLVARLRGREPTPLPMILGEIWGGVVGLCGEYGRSVRRSAAIRAAAAPGGGDAAARERAA